MTSPRLRRGIALPIDVNLPARRAPSRLMLSSLTLAVAAACGAFDASAARLAMVVGNDAYQNATPLRNARNDAQSLARELEAAGFRVTRLLDATRSSFNDALDGFLRKIEKGDEVVFFFSGHGSQPPQLGPYLLPVDIRVTGERAIQLDGQSLDQLVDDLNRRARFSLVIVDACRNDPFRETVAGRALPPGSSLSRIEPPRGSMIIMAASKGQQALDSLGRSDPVPNGLFTRELIKQMRTPGLSASDMLKRVRGSVEAAANTVNHQQRPSLMDESSTDFYFYPAGSRPLAQAAPEPARFVAPAPAPAPVPASVPARAPAPAPVPLTTLTTPPAPAPAPPPRASATVSDAQREFDAWEAAGRVGTRAAFDAFISQYPEGRYTPQARVRVAGMAAAPAPAPAAAPAAPPKPAAYNPQAEFEVWDRAATSKLKADYENYLSQYPNGRYVELARAALKKL
jgi:uncharacterized caspase-like protein